jgi:hypothetical protein
MTGNHGQKLSTRSAWHIQFEARVTFVMVEKRVTASPLTPGPPAALLAYFQLQTSHFYCLQGLSLHETLLGLCSSPPFLPPSSPPLHTTPTHSSHHYHSPSCYVTSSHPNATPTTAPSPLSVCQQLSPYHFSHPELHTPSHSQSPLPYVATHSLPLPITTPKYSPTLPPTPHDHYITHSPTLPPNPYYHSHI